MIIVRTDPFTGKTNMFDLDVTEEEYDTWESGVSAQAAFPRLNADDREFIMTGIMPDSWDKYLSDPDDLQP